MLDEEMLKLFIKQHIAYKQAEKRALENYSSLVAKLDEMESANEFDNSIFKEIERADALHKEAVKDTNCHARACMGYLAKCGLV